MTNIIAIVLLSGASCVSHIDQSDALKVTLASKVPCAVVIRQPTGNPYKAAQATNEVSAVKAKAAPKKKGKKKRKARR